MLAAEALQTTPGTDLGSVWAAFHTSAGGHDQTGCCGSPPLLLHQLHGMNHCWILLMHSTYFGRVLKPCAALTARS